MIRQKNDMPLKDILKQFTNSKKIKKQLTKTKIISLWGRIMGPTIEQYTKKIELNRGTLFLTIESAALRQELSYGKEKIQKILNEELGEAYITEVIIR
jgi:predicted nucleic acid-binding Zn ribbon protein